MHIFQLIHTKIQFGIQLINIPISNADQRNIVTANRLHKNKWNFNVLQASILN